MSAPLILTTKGLDDYALVDSGHGRKLERFGAMLLDRPEEQAIWTPRLSKNEWEKADAIFTGDVDEEGAGRWKRRAGLDEAWECRHGAIRFICRFTSFRHVGAFPEQEAHFSFMRERLTEGWRDALAPQPLRLYRSRLAGRGRGRRRGHAYRCLEEGDRLGAREPGAVEARRQADPLDFGRRTEIRRARGPARAALRRHPARPAEIRPRAEGRGVGALSESSRDAEALPRAVEARRIPDPDRLRDPRVVPVAAPAVGGSARAGRRIRASLR